MRHRKKNAMQKNDAKIHPLMVWSHLTNVGHFFFIIHKIILLCYPTIIIFNTISTTSVGLASLSLSLFVNTHKLNRYYAFRYTGLDTYLLCDDSILRRWCMYVHVGMQICVQILHCKSLYSLFISAILLLIIYLEGTSATRYLLLKKNWPFPFRI